VAAPDIYWRSAVVHLTKTQFMRALPLPTAVYRRNRDRPENHGAPGSNPGLATYSYSGLQVKSRETKRTGRASGPFFQLPKRSGRSRQGAPVRNFQMTASTNSRLPLSCCARHGRGGLEANVQFAQIDRRSMHIVSKAASIKKLP
jgi:hypothetical protein